MYKQTQRLLQYAGLEVHEQTYKQTQRLLQYAGLEVHV